MCVCVHTRIMYGSTCILSAVYVPVFLDCGTEMFNAEVLFKEDCTSDEFVDVILGNRVYLPCLYVSIGTDGVSV